MRGRAARRARLRERRQVRVPRVALQRAPQVRVAGRGAQRARRCRVGQRRRRGAQQASRDGALACARRPPRREAACLCSWRSFLMRRCAAPAPHGTVAQRPARLHQAAERNNAATGRTRARWAHASVRVGARGHAPVQRCSATSASASRRSGGSRHWPCSMHSLTLSSVMTTFCSRLSLTPALQHRVRVGLGLGGRSPPRGRQQHSTFSCIPA